MSSRSQEVGGEALIVASRPSIGIPGRGDVFGGQFESYQLAAIDVEALEVLIFSARDGRTYTVGTGQSM